MHWWRVGSWHHLVGPSLGGSSSLPPTATGQTMGCWGPEACLAKHQILWGTFSKLVINFHFNCITLLLAEMGVGAAFLREEMLAVLPRYVTGTVMTSAWGDKGSTAHPAARLWRGISGVTCSMGFVPSAEGGLPLMSQFSASLLFELLLPFQ